MPLPQYLGGSAASQEQQALDYYLNYNNPEKNPNSFYDSDMAAAQQSLGGFSGGRRGLLRRSQIMENLAAATPILEARAGRAAQHASQTQAEAADLAKLAQAGKQAEAMERLSQQGRLESDTRAAAAQRADTILKGQQAIQQLQQDQMGRQILTQMGINSNEKIAAGNNASREYLQNDEQLFTAGENAKNRNFSVAAAERGYQNSNTQLGSKLATDLQLGKNKGANSATQDVLAQIISGNSLTPQAWKPTQWSGGASEPSAGTSNPTVQIPQPFYYVDQGGGGTGVVGQPQGSNQGTGEGDLSDNWSEDYYWQVYGGG